MKRVLMLGVALAALGCGDRSGVPTARSLSPENADDQLAGYSPDGKQIYWWQRAGDQWQLYRSPADMSAPESLSLFAQDPSNGNGQLLWSPDGSRFAVSAENGSGFPVIWLMSAGGGAPRRITSAGTYEAPSSWNPDGKRLLYATVLDRNVYAMVVNVDSGAPARLLPSETSPHFAFWSPDGSKLGIFIYGQGHGTIWLADSSGGHLRQATTEGFEQPTGYPTPWSPDGSALLYQSSRTGTSDIWVLPVDGSPARQLTHDVRDDLNASWSPDGRWVAFQSNRGLQNDLWVIPAAGGEARRVTDDDLNEGLLGWRPGTEQLAYTTGRDRRTLWSRALAAGEEHQLTPDSLDVAFFNLSSTGQVEVSIARGGGVVDIATMPMSGGELRTLLRDARGNVAHWSPNGSKLVLLSRRTGANQRAWVMDADGGNLHQLTNWQAGDDVGAVFSDDSTVYVRSNHESRFGDLWRVAASGGEPIRITQTGGIIGICWQARRPGEVLVPVVADAPVVIASARLRPGGVLQPIWDRTTSVCPLASPTADSVVVTTAAGADLQTMLLPLGGGQGRPVLEKNQVPITWSPDGREVLFTYTRNEPYDLGILTVADGSVRRITQTPESETRTEWSADGSTLVFTRVVPVSRITTADVTRLLSQPAPGERRR
jgi:Tol biopolymer transport system component